MSTEPVSRRTLLKALLAGSSSLAALSFLPENWLRPIIRGGVLPEHAMVSAPVCSTGLFSMVPLVTPTTEVQLITFINTPSSMNGESITWKLTSLPTFSDGITFVNTPPSKPLPLLEGTDIVSDLGSYGYGIAVLYGDGKAAPYITGVPGTISAVISFTTPDSTTCAQTYTGIMVQTLEI